MHLRKINRGNWQSVEAGHAVSIKHLRSEGLEDDALIDLNLDAAEQDIETDLGFPIVDCQLTGFQCDFSAISLPSFPSYRTDTITVKYLNENEELTDLDAGKFYILDDGIWLRIIFKTDLPTLYDREDAVQITFDAGFASSVDVPALYKQVILTRAASRYADREEVAEKWKKASDSMIEKIKNRKA